MILKIDEFEKELHPTKDEPASYPDDIHALYFPSDDIQTKLFKGDSKRYHLSFLSFELSHLLEKHKGKAKGKLRIIDTYKENELEVQYDDINKLK